ncbi:hypothetical protein HIM_04942 [Hirsutella minnesotensis 3608]|uniref:Transcription factor domain-containing protein n=1 Tax=Hirsutella minnesotensis 3608 TaxID=1043627 RepID=A0A0F7ZPN0_9HYPO|nr:hypothetical protein HIM_04942 [Hirsutella minnesotensis 3608]
MSSAFGNKLTSLETEMGFSGIESLFRIFGDRYDWHLHILRLPSLTPALENALLALCTARLGRQGSRPGLGQKSLQLYTKGVALVRRDVLNASAQTAVDEQSLAACLSLLLYEAVECPGGTMDGYQAHYRGCLELLRLRGAVSSTSALAHATLQILRLHTIHIVLGDPPCALFLDQPEWLDIPWTGQSYGKSSFDRLVDILLNVSKYYTQTHVLVTNPRSLLQNASILIEQGQRLKDLLESWFKGFQAAVPGPLYHVELSKIETAFDELELGKLLPIAFYFPSFSVGQALVYYWIAIVIIQSRLHQTQAYLESLDSNELPCTCGTAGETPSSCVRHFSADSPPSFGTNDVDVRAAACNICQSVEYFLQDTMRGFGLASMLPGLMWVKWFWSQKLDSHCWDRELAWIDDVVGRIHSSGYGIAAALGGRLREGEKSQSR